MKAIRTLLCTLLLAATPLALQAQTVEERLTKLEKLLQETRAQLAAATATVSAAAPGSDPRLDELARAVEILAKEIEALKLGEAGATEAKTSHAGMGPAASKVYAARKGVSIGGYGEAVYANFAKTRQDGALSARTDQADLLRAIVYFGYKFDDRFVLNSELEVEHAISGGSSAGEVAMEFAYLDYLHRKELSFRAGLVLIPMGFLNEYHEPPSFSGTLRPDVERVLIPTTFRELGFGGYGDVGPVSYRLYVSTGLDASRYGAAGIRNGRSKGSVAAAEDFALTGRVDVTGVPGLLAGVSFFTGGAGQGRVTPSGERIGARTTLFDLHAEWRWRGLSLRGLSAHTRVSDAALVNQLNGFKGQQSVGSKQEGWYLQAGFDFLSLVPGAKASLTPFVRYERTDTQAEVPDGYARNPANDVSVLTLGVGFKPIENIVLKLDWQQRKNAAETGVDQWNVGLGYLF